MSDFIDYIESAFNGEKDDGTLYRFKRQLLEKMNERADEITHTGLKDDKVLYDLVVSEFSDLKKAYTDFCFKDKLKKRDSLFNKIMIIGTPAVALLLVALFLAVGFITDMWSPAWVIIPSGILLWTVFLLSEGINRITRLRRLFHPIARVMLALAVMCITVSVFLVLLSVLQLPKAWTFVPFGVICIYAADAVYAFVTKQKLRIINYLIYIPAAAPMVYVILGGLGIIPWDPGWLIVIFSVIADFIIIAAKAISNSKYKYRPEVDEAWNEG
ncbi:MAG: hypothetical protein ACI4SB_04975 [Acutalibacteraceae bacterium]